MRPWQGFGMRSLYLHHLSLSSRALLTAAAAVADKQRNSRSPSRSCCRYHGNRYTRTARTCRSAGPSTIAPGDRYIRRTPPPARICYHCPPSQLQGPSVTTHMTLFTDFIKLLS